MVVEAEEQDQDGMKADGRLASEVVADISPGTTDRNQQRWSAHSGRKPRPQDAEEEAVAGRKKLEQRCKKVASAFDPNVEDAGHKQSTCSANQIV